MSAVELPMNDATNDERWHAVETRDRRHDGSFVFGVVTTGIFCRPSCAARRPLRENVRFFGTTAEAVRAGLRACKRCHPLETGESREVAAVRAACDYLRIQSTEGERVALASAARAAGTNEVGLRRAFRSVLGISPRDYVESCRLEALRGHLRASDSVTLAIYDAGFGSGARVYERANDRLGMTPRQYARGGGGVEIAFATTGTALGRMMVAATPRGVCFVQFGENDAAIERALRREFPNAELHPAGRDDERLRRWLEAVRALVSRERTRAELPLDVRASAFQIRVWRALQAIPAGETRTYTEVARALGRPRAVRAVARACATNPVALVVPCHRVVRADGGLGGYRWGLSRKKALLAAERAARSASSAKTGAKATRRARRGRAG